MTILFISTHTLTWSVTFTILYFLKWKKHFNSHAHVERDAAKMFLYFSLSVISTHTLTWSVTWLKTWEKVEILFQLTRSRGA